jgi:4-hydroxybenzoate polyprenyltransferase
LSDRALPAAPVKPRAGTGRDLIALARPGQWAKNVLVVPLVLLDLHVWNAGGLLRVGWAIAVLTVASALVYAVNDITDRHRDRLHPTKRHRPIASGRVSVRAAATLAAVELGLLVGLVSLQPLAHSWPAGAYLLLAAAYSAGLKHVPLVDVFVVAAGFGLRLLMGYAAVGAGQLSQVSGWLLTCVFSLCLLLTVGKRRHELVAAGVAHRPALRGYTVPLADQLMVLSAMLAVGAYLLYLRTEAPLGPYSLAAAVVCAPLALFGLFRYLQLVLVNQHGGNPAHLLVRDPVLVANSLLWVAVSGAFLLASRAP